MPNRSRFILVGADVATLARQLSTHELGDAHPSDWWDSDGNQRTTGDWLADLRNARRNFTVTWGADEQGRYDYRLSVDLLDGSVTWTDCRSSAVRDALSLLRREPFRLAVGTCVHPEWNKRGHPLRHRDCLAFGFGWHGWMCAFKGDGHDQLVSRRWLEHGPWRLIRDESRDLSFVQFHDLEADAVTALEQAKPGHMHMGLHEHGGFMADHWTIEHDLNGLYHPTEQFHEIVVHGRDVSQREMLELAMFRYRNRHDASRPIQRIAYVFMERAVAEAHLHELWLRDIECWAIVDGVKTRLDADYEPPAPVKPEWVRRVEAQSEGVNAP